MRFNFIVFFTLFLVSSMMLPLQAESVRDWASDYSRLSSSVAEKEKEPAYKSSLAEYIKWLKIKAKDRDEIKSILQEVTSLKNIDKESQKQTDWKKQFGFLLDWAQESGNLTARLGADYLLLAKAQGQLSWAACVDQVNTYGRSLYVAVKQTGFDYEYVRDKAQCHLRFAIGDVETGNLGLYYKRINEFGKLDSEGNTVIPDRDFDVNCERRGEFINQEKGEPIYPLDKGLEGVNRIREECRWWNFSDEEKDASDLMVQYYRDVLCLKPSDKSHKWYMEQAEKYKLEPALEYSRGFYAVLFGIVELNIGQEKIRTGNIKITVTDPRDGTAWENMTDDNGEYEIKNALLAKQCSPYKIKAEYEDCKFETEFDGPLDKPNPSFRFEKKLEIECPLKGEIVYNHDITSSLGHRDFKMEESMKGSVPFQYEAGQLKGGGKIQTSGTGRARKTASSNRGVIDVVISGNLKKNADGKFELIVELSETFNQTLQFRDGAIPIPPRTFKHKLVFPLKHGHTIEEPCKHELCEGKYRWTLNLKK